MDDDGEDVVVSNNVAEGVRIVVVAASVTVSVDVDSTTIKRTHNGNGGSQSAT